MGEATKHDSGKPRMSLIPFKALREVAKILTFGEMKYGVHNWRQGMDWSRLEDAMLRHYTAYQEGQDLDDESGLPHLAHMACCVLFLLTYYLDGLGKDDRHK